MRSRGLLDLNIHPTSSVTLARLSMRLVSSCRPWRPMKTRDGSRGFVARYGNIPTLVACERRRTWTLVFVAKSGHERRSEPGTRQDAGEDR